MRYDVKGTVLQSLEVYLQPGEMIYSQTHQMAWMMEGIKMDTTSGGLVQGFMRSLTGASFFLTSFTNKASNERLVAFCPRFPGTILPCRLGPQDSMVCRKESFLCAESTVKLDLFFRKQIGSGLFGGEGFILQKISGPGLVFLDLSGEVVERTLAQGEKLIVHVGHVGAQDISVQFGITLMKGFKNILFGGDGLFLATLTGPGRVILQSMPIENLAESIFQYLPSSGEAPSD